MTSQLNYYVARQRQVELARQAERLRQALADVNPESVAHVPRKSRGLMASARLRRLRLAERRANT